MSSDHRARLRLHPWRGLSLFAAVTLVASLAPATALGHHHPWPPETPHPTPKALAFVGQPATTVKAQAITDAPLGTGDPVQVELLDDQGDLVKVDGLTITLTAGGGPSSLSGATSATTDDGLASFPGISLAGVGTYTLTATASGLTAATSEPFQIVDAGAACPAGSGCSTSASGGTNGSTDLGVSGDPSSQSGILTIAFTGTVSCRLPVFRTPYPATSAVFTVDLTTNATKVFDLTISRAAAKAARKPFAFQYHVCFNAPTQFRQLLGVQAAADPVNGGYTGILPGCLTVLTDDLPSLPRSGSGPCVEWKYNDFQGNVHIRFFAPAGDPRGYS